MRRARRDEGQLFRPKQQQKVSLSSTKLILGAVLLCIAVILFNLRFLHILSGNDLAENVPVGAATKKPKSVGKTNFAVIEGDVVEPPLQVLKQKGDTADRHASSRYYNATLPGNDSLSSSSSSSSDVQYHIIFSTGCSIKQDWQSYMFFYHAMKSGQLGNVTRIASGCKEKEAIELQELHESQIRSISPRFHLHLTPEFSRVKPGVRFKYFNKPFGVLHWMTHGLGYPQNASQHDDSIVILFDPDQIILRPLTNDFTNSIEKWRRRRSHPYVMKVDHGYPFAQQYGFHMQWRAQTNISEFASPSPVETMSTLEAMENYAAGPPYMATGRDMYKIVTKWTEFVPHVHTQYPHLLAEMFGYSLAAAHLQLPHQLAQTFMLSDTKSLLEGWKTLVEPSSESDVCGDVPPSHLPHVIHYCQRYALGKWFIGKHRLPKDFLSCETPLLATPPKTIATQYDFAILPYKNHEVVNYDRERTKRHAFMLCYLIPALNDAATYYKQHNCQGSSVNYNETLVFFDSMEIEENQKEDEQ